MKKRLKEKEIWEALKTEEKGWRYLRDNPGYFSVSYWLGMMMLVVCGGALISAVWHTYNSIVYRRRYVKLVEGRVNKCGNKEQ